MAKMQAEVGVEVTGSRSWTKGTSAGVSYSIAPVSYTHLAVYKRQTLYGSAPSCRALYVCTLREPRFVEQKQARTLSAERFR